MTPNHYSRNFRATRPPRKHTEPPNPRIWFAACALCLVFLLPSTTKAIVIDDFSTPAQTEQVGSIEKSVVVGPGILGDERLMVLLLDFDLPPQFIEVCDGAMEFTNDGPTQLGVAFMHYDGVGDISAGGPGLGPADLTDGGASDRFYIEVTELINEASIFVRIFSDNNILDGNVLSITAPGVYEIAFSDMVVSEPGFPAPDPAAVPELRLQIHLPPNSSVSVESFSTGGAVFVGDSGGGGACTGPDADGDGVLDEADLCPGTTAGLVDAAGCSDAQVDSDADGFCNPDAPSTGPSGCVGTDNCPTVFNPDQADSNDDGFGDACVDPTVDISDDADVDPTATIGADSDIDKGAMVGAGVDIGENVDVKQNVAIGDNTTVGDGTTIDQNATIGANVTIGEGVSIGRDVVIEDGAVIGDFVILDRGTFIGANATVESAASIGRDAVICTTARIEAGLILGRNALVQTGVVQTTDIPGSSTGHSPAECAALP